MMVAVDEGSVYRQYADELIRYATALVGPNDAPDVVTEGVLDAFRSDEWDHVLNRRAYLYRCVLRRALSMRRSSERRWAREHRAAGREPERVDDPSVDAHRALAHLSPQQRAVVFLAYWHDLAPEQIAEMLDVSEGTVRKQLARARERLRSVLDER